MQSAIVANSKQQIGIDSENFSDSFYNKSQLNCNIVVWW